MAQSRKSSDQLSSRRVTWSLKGRLAKEVRFFVHFTAMKSSRADISWLVSLAMPPMCGMEEIRFSSEAAAPPPEDSSFFPPTPEEEEKSALPPPEEEEVDAELAAAAAAEAAAAAAAMVSDTKLDAAPILEAAPKEEDEGHSVEVVEK